MATPMFTMLVWVVVDSLMTLKTFYDCETHRSLRRRAPHPQCERQLKARLRVVEGRAERLAQLVEPVADRLRVDVERAGRLVDAALAVKPRAQALGQPLAGRRAQRQQRRQPCRRELAREHAVGQQ